MWIAVHAGVPCPLPGFDPGVLQQFGASNTNRPPRPVVVPSEERSLAGRATNETTEPAIVVQRAYDLALWLIQKVEKFPRSFRFSIGDRLIARALDVLETLVVCAYSTDKRLLLEQANRSVNSLRYLLRMGVDLKLMGADSQEFSSGKLEEIGRMVGGWRKAAAQRAGG